MSFSVFRLLGWFNGECYAATSASLELGSTSLSTTATQGNTSYLSSTIKATASDIESYTLSITGPVGLSSTNGNSSITTITGANNNKPSSMPNNSWGYAYNDSNSNENKTYQSFTGSAQTLESGTTPSGIAKNITFAAKFSDDAVAGHYTALVHINLVATPKATTYTLTLNNNGGMGGTTTKICSTYTNSCDISLSDAVIPTKDGYAFLGWADNNSATSATYTTTSTITMTADKTIYAVWKNSIYTLTYDANGGGGAPASQQCAPNVGQSTCIITITTSQPTTKPPTGGYIGKYTFRGWRTDKTTGDVYTAGNTITLNDSVTLYAYWYFEAD